MELSENGKDFVDRASCGGKMRRLVGRGEFKIAIDFKSRCQKASGEGEKSRLVKHLGKDLGRRNGGRNTPEPW